MTERSTAFFINGGAGRVLTSIPALENYHKENPDDDFIIVCEGGMDMYKGHPILHERAYDAWHKNLFEEHLKNRNCVSPEPYRVWEYYNQKASLAQAFDIAINNKGLRDVNIPKIYLNKVEINEAFNVINQVKNQTGFDKILVVQPFGRTTANTDELVIDPTSRSFNLTDIVDIINELKKEYSVIVMSEFPFALEEGEPKNPVAMPQIPDIRIWSAIIEMADHFLGCDSVGQHLAKALGKTASVVFGSTFPINTSYVNDKDFDIIDTAENTRVYSPIRMTGEEMQDRINDSCMDLTDKDKQEIIKIVKARLGKSVKADVKVENNSVGNNQPAVILNKSGE